MPISGRYNLILILATFSRFLFFLFFCLTCYADYNSFKSSMYSVCVQAPQFPPTFCRCFANEIDEQSEQWAKQLFFDSGELTQLTPQINTSLRHCQNRAALADERLIEHNLGSFQKLRTTFLDIKKAPTTSIDGIFLWQLLIVGMLMYIAYRIVRTSRKPFDYGKASQQHAGRYHNSPPKEEDFNAKHNEHEQPHDNTGIRIFRCPSCKQKLRVILPISERTGHCTNCSSRFKVYSDQQGNVYIESIPNSEKQNEAVPKIDECFSIIGVQWGADSQTIKAAYRRRIMEYHPDKVAKLGAELRELAERKARLINAAYDMLTRHGFVR
jgi:DnaJ-domain-containing protein 1